MAGLIVNEGELLILDNLIVNLFDPSTFLHLFVNDKIPAPGDTFFDYTEASYPGYAAIALNAWGAAFINGDGEAQSNETIRTITSTGSSAQVVYGYMVSDGGGPTLLFAERNPSGPVAIDASGIPYSVQPIFRFRNALPAA